MYFYAKKYSIYIIMLYKTVIQIVPLVIFCITSDLSSFQFIVTEI